MIDFGSQVAPKFKLDLEAGKNAFRCGLWLWSSRYQLAKVQGVRAMIDINSRAIDLAKQMLNETRSSYYLESNIYENVTGSFDYIISNPLLITGAEGDYQLSRRHMIISIKGESNLTIIQEKQGAPSAKPRWRCVW